MAAFAKTHQDIVHPLDHHPAFFPFFLNFGDDFIEDGFGVIDFFTGGDFADDLQRSDLTIAHTGDEIFGLLESEAFHHLFHLFGFEHGIFEIQPELAECLFAHFPAQ